MAFFWRGLSIFLAAGLAAAGAVPAWAGDLTVLGGKIETTAETGLDYSYSMTVQNTSSAPMDIAVEIKGYGTDSENPFVMLEPEQDISHHSAREYLTATPSDFHLGSGESREISISASIPQGGEAGGKYAIVYIHTVPKSGSVATTAGMAARVLLTVESPDLNHASRINSLSWSAAQNLQALIDLTDQGNQHYKPHLRGTLKKGENVVALATADDVWPVIPHYSRRFSLDFKPTEVLPAGDYSLQVEVLDESQTVVAQETAGVTLETAYSPGAALPSAAPVQPPGTPAAPVNLVLKPATEGLLASRDGSIAINFPQGAVTGEAALTLKGYEGENTPAAPPGFAMGDTCFSVEGLNGLLAREAILSVKYSAGDLERAGGDPSRLALARWDEPVGNWVVLKTGVDAENLTLTAKTDRFSTWAVMATPVGSSKTRLLTEVGVAAVVVLFAMLLVMKRKRRQLKA